MMNNRHFIRVLGEIGWIYVLGFVDGKPAFLNPLVPGDYLLYVNGHQDMKPIAWEQYMEIYEALCNGFDPAATIQNVIQSIGE